MRGVILSAFLAVSAVSAFNVTPAAARDYPYCLQGRGPGYPGECSYVSFEQCQASASGRNASCGVNPRAAFAQQRNNRRGARDDYFGGGRY